VRVALIILLFFCNFTKHHCRNQFFLDFSATTENYSNLSRPTEPPDFSTLCFLAQLLKRGHGGTSKRAQRALTEKM
jgi:hypothetical protein